MYLSKRDKQLLKTLANPHRCRPNEYIPQDFVCQWSTRRKKKVNYNSDAVAFRRLADLGLVSLKELDGEMCVRIEESGRNRAAAVRRGVILKILACILEAGIVSAVTLLVEHVANHLN